MSTPPTRYAIVTGAASGIGHALTSRLVAAGYRVAAVDRDEATLAKSVEPFGDAALPCPMDVANTNAWRRLTDSLRSEWPCLDLLVNNAGVLNGGELHRCEPAELTRVVEVNLIGTMVGCRTVAPWLIESRSISQPAARNGVPRSGIINTASIFATLAPPGFAAYSASKAGVVALSESLRGELDPHGLNVTVALPGTTPTALFARAKFATPTFAEVVDRYQSTTELTADRVAEAMLAAAAKGRPYAVIGRKARRFAWFKRLNPGATMRRVAAQARRELGLPSPADAPEND